MKAYEFSVKVNTEGEIGLPDAIFQKLAHNQQVQVIILVNEPSVDEEDQTWHRLATEELLKGYSAEDSIYDTI